mmetsp:Transcript_282/g.297  ORF Transcript_282/g.297 Transcript_282/m.297 type:complete len:317 (-) Transcript_282:169-1119(-)
MGEEVEAAVDADVVVSVGPLGLRGVLNVSKELRFLHAAPDHGALLVGGLLVAVLEDPWALIGPIRVEEEVHGHLRDVALALALLLRVVLLLLAFQLADHQLVRRSWPLTDGPLLLGGTLPRVLIPAVVLPLDQLTLNYVVLPIVVVHDRLKAIARLPSLRRVVLPTHQLRILLLPIQPDNVAWVGLLEERVPPIWMELEVGAVLTVLHLEVVLEEEASLLFPCLLSTGVDSQHFVLLLNFLKDRGGRTSDLLSLSLIDSDRDFLGNVDNAVFTLHLENVRHYVPRVLAGSYQIEGDGGDRKQCKHKYEDFIPSGGP